MFRYVAFCAALLGWQLLPTGGCLAQVIQKIALTGDPVPAARTGAVLGGSFQLPNFNNQGQAVFLGALDDGSSSDQAILVGDVTGIQPVAVSGERAPGTGEGVSFHRFDILMPSLSNIAPQISDGGDVVFMSSLQSTNRLEPIRVGVNSLGLWRWNAAGTELVLRTGDPVPEGTNGEVFSFDFIMNDINATGEVSLVAMSRDDSFVTQRGLWRTENGFPAKVAIEGNEVPGYPGYAFTPTLNDVRARHLDNLGRLNFEASAYKQPDTLSGIWREDGGSYELLVAEEQPVPGETDLTFARVYGTVFNDLGDSSFRVELQGPEASATNDEGIWKYQAGSLVKVVRQGDPVPLAGENLSFGQTFPHAMSDSGGIAFTATMHDASAGANHQGLWKQSGGNYELVKRAGEQAPGTEPDVVFLNTFFGDPEINVHDQVAFWSYLTGEGIDDTNDIGVWAQDLQGLLHLIVREGDLLEVAPGDFRTVKQLNRDTFPSDLQSTTFFNDRGQVLFSASFTDGTSGVFISNLVAVPETSSLALAALGLIAGGGLRRR